MRSTTTQLPDSIWRRTLFAVAFALTINIILYYGGRLLVPGGYLVMLGGDAVQPVPFAAVVFTTAIGMGVGAIIYWLLRTFVNEEPDTIFAIVAAVAVLASLTAPLYMAVGFLTKIILSLMHIVAAAVLVRFLTR